MSIKPDHWIRKMALEHSMIEPFVDHQVREGVISYGLSSYGYDIRVANEFRIFTSGLGDLTVVDPKHFDARSMVDYHGDTCVIPPNSFALARTVEYFRIPRNVLTICLGKSTYARCFRGDTRIALVDGTSPTLEEMTRRAEEGEMFWGYSIGENGRLIVTLLDSPRYIGRDSLMEMTLDDEQTIFCTPDHPFMLRDGRWQIAAELQPGASLMPLYRTLQRGYEVVYQPINGHLYPTHRLADEWNLRHEIYAEQISTHRHHVDFDRLNNNPWNLVRMDVGEHSAARYLNCDRAVFRRFPEVLREFRGKSAADNHKVLSVRSLPGDHDVFCLTVPEAGNFALESGVFVHNCGIIVNVTPFEPSWDGYATLEISNTTPLPARIYANEGIAQVLFFEGDPPEQSYADKKGKYQGQVGITLPRL